MMGEPATAFDFLGQARELYATVGAALEGSVGIPSKSDRNLSELGAVLCKLEDYSKKFPISFSNQTVCILFGQVLKLLPLLLYDSGSEMKRGDIKSFARFASAIFIALAEEKVSGSNPVSGPIVGKQERKL